MTQNNSIFILVLYKEKEKSKRVFLKKQSTKVGTFPVGKVLVLLNNLREIPKAGKQGRNVIRHDKTVIMS